mgnify:CR=1 FL=1
MGAEEPRDFQDIERGKRWGERHLRDHENLSQAGGELKKRGKGATAFYEFIESEKEGAPAWSLVKDQCMHCKSPACASACPAHVAIPAYLAELRQGRVQYPKVRALKRKLLDAARRLGFVVLDPGDRLLPRLLPRRRPRPRPGRRGSDRRCGAANARRLRR